MPKTLSVVLLEKLLRFADLFPFFLAFASNPTPGVH